MMCKTIDEENKLICLKEIWITNDMRIQIKALGKPISLNIFNINNEILLSLNMLEDLIKTVEYFNICEGNNNMQEIDCTSVAIKESKNILRHKKCPIMLENASQCNFCKSISYTLDRKRKRLNNKGNDTKRIRIDNISPTKREIINNMRKQKHALTQCKSRKISTIKKLQEMLEETQTNLNVKDIKTLQDAMVGKNIPVNEQEALKEILSASLRKNARGRRYSDKWLLLCLLFHMKSPKGYDFI